MLTSTLSLCRPGDVLLYKSKSLVGWLIRMRTWSDVEHVEIYVGDGQSVASRNGIGVNSYPFRRDGLAYILRPIGDLDIGALKTFAKSQYGTPYGWLDLLSFYSIKIPSKGLICSQFADLCLRAAGFNALAANYPAGQVSPRDFLLSPMFDLVYSSYPSYYVPNK